MSRRLAVVGTGAPHSNGTSDSVPRPRFRGRAICVVPSSAGIEWTTAIPVIERAFATGGRSSVTVIWSEGDEVRIQDRGARVFLSSPLGDAAAVLESVCQRLGEARKDPVLVWTSSFVAPEPCTATVLVHAGVPEARWSTAARVVALRADVVQEAVTESVARAVVEASCRTV